MLVLFLKKKGAKWKTKLRLGNVFGFDYWPTTFLTFNKLTFLLKVKPCSRFLWVYDKHWCYPTIKELVTGLLKQGWVQSQHHFLPLFVGIGQSLCMVKFSGWDRLTTALMLLKKKRVMLFLGYDVLFPSQIDSLWIEESEFGCNNWIPRTGRVACSSVSHGCLPKVWFEQVQIHARGPSENRHIMGFWKLGNLGDGPFQSENHRNISKCKDR